MNKIGCLTQRLITLSYSAEDNLQLSLTLAYHLKIRLKILYTALTFIWRSDRYFEEDSDLHETSCIADCYTCQNTVT